jgi:hypothetical protein
MSFGKKIISRVVKEPAIRTQHHAKKRGRFQLQIADRNPRIFANSEIRIRGLSAFPSLENAANSSACTLDFLIFKFQIPVDISIESTTNLAQS